MIPRALLAIGLALSAAACTTGREPSGFDGDPAPSTPQDQEQAPQASGGASTGGDFGKQVPPAPETAEVREVYGHSGTTLYKLEPLTKTVTVIGDFKGCKPIIDIALDEKSTIYAVSFDFLYTVDKTTAACTKVRGGQFPNSLSFVPKGTVLPDEEALVGYDKADYVRIDPKTGDRTVIGTLDGGPGVESSGDIVSVKGGKTFLTVRGGACAGNDCLFEVDPKTGKKVRDWGSIEHAKVFGLSFWGGRLYGFDASGDLFEVTFGLDKVATTPIPMPQRPVDLSFWGAGSSTSAPLVVDPQ